MLKLLVKNWRFGSITNPDGNNLNGTYGDQRFPYVVGRTFDMSIPQGERDAFSTNVSNVEDRIPSQLNAQSPNHFNAHWIVGIDLDDNGIIEKEYFDPSYGVGVKTKTEHAEAGIAGVWIKSQTSGETFIIAKKPIGNPADDLEYCVWPEVHGRKDCN